MKLIFLALSIALFLSISIFAQTGSKVTGTVHLGDEETVLHQVSVQIVELKLRTTTDTLGNYQFLNVPPGNYTITAHQEGFRDLSQKITVTGGTAATADFRLQIAGVKADVTVTASGSEQTAFESIARVSSMDSSQITSRAAVGLGDVLNNESGVANVPRGRGRRVPSSAALTGTVFSCLVKELVWVRLPLIRECFRCR